MESLTQLLCHRGQGDGVGGAGEKGNNQLELRELGAARLTHVPHSEDAERGPDCNCQEDLTEIQKKKKEEEEYTDTILWNIQINLCSLRKKKTQTPIEYK